MSEKAPLQNQFSECPRFGRSCIEEQRRRRGMRMRNEREFIDAKIDAENFASSRAQLLVTTGTTARKILQHWVPDGGGSGFTGSE